MISVILTTYNGERYIIEQLDSIRRQTIAPDDVAIYDDGSKDQTIEIVRNYISKYCLSGWHLERNIHNKGFYKNFIDAICVSQGDTIYLSDQDDVWDLQKIEKSEKIFKSQADVCMVQSDIVMIDENDKQIEKQDNYHKKPLDRTQIELSLDDICRFAGSGYTMAFRKNVANIIRTNYFLFKPELFQFHDIVCGLVAVSDGKCIFDRTINDKHRIHTDNVTKKKGNSFISNRSRENQIEICEKRAQYFLVVAGITKNPEKKSQFSEYSNFNKSRATLIKKYSLNKYLEVKHNKEMYYSRFGLYTDLLYALHLDSLVKLGIKILGE